MTPEEMDRVLARDAEGVRASPRLAVAVMTAVRHEAKTPPPIPFPWTRAAPGIVAALLLVVFAVASLVSAPSAEAPPSRAPVAIERVAEVTAKVEDFVASWDARSATIWLVVATLSAVPVLAPLVLVRDERKA